MNPCKLLEKTAPWGGGKWKVESGKRLDTIYGFFFFLGGGLGGVKLRGGRLSVCLSVLSVWASGWEVVCGIYVCPYLHK